MRVASNDGDCKVPAQLFTPMLQRRLRTHVFDTEQYCRMCDGVGDICGDTPWCAAVVATTQKGTISFATARISTAWLLVSTLSWSVMISCVPDPWSAERARRAPVMTVLIQQKDAGLLTSMCPGGAACLCLPGFRCNRQSPPRIPPGSTARPPISTGGRHDLYPDGIESKRAKTRTAWPLS